MGQVVRRTEKPSSINIEEHSELRAAVRRDGDGFAITSQVNAGADPRVLLAWNVEPKHFRQGFKLLGFRSTKGFSAEDDPENLSEHGEKFLEERANGRVEQAVAEGTYFYTFVLYKRRFFGMGRSLSEPLRFSEEIRSVKVAVSRIEDRMRLARLGNQHERNMLEDEVTLNNATINVHRSRKRLKEATEERPEEDPLQAQVRREVEPLIRRGLVRAHTRIEMAVEVANIKKKLKKHPGWRSLKKPQRDKILEDIAADLDGGEATWNP